MNLSCLTSVLPGKTTDSRNSSSLNSLYSSLGHLCNTQQYRMTIEKLILEGPIQTMFPEDNTETPLLGVKLFASQYNETV